MKSLVLASLLWGSSGQSPIRKVVTLIEEMKAQVEQEGKDDLKAYDEYKCWCNTGGEEKKRAIEYATEMIAELEAFLGEAAGKEGEFRTEIGTLEKDIAADNAAIADANGVRDSENAEFQTEESDMKDSIALIANAVEVLQKALGFAQTSAKDRKVLLQVSQVIKTNMHRFQDVMMKDIYDVLGSLKSYGGDDGMKDAYGFLGTNNAAKQPSGRAAGAKSYNSASGEIIGLLSAMGDELRRDLTADQKQEFKALVDFQKLRAAKLAEIQATTQQKELTEQALADLLDRAAKAFADLENMKAAKAADEKFLAELTQNCQVVDQEYQARSKIRSQEVIALSETIEILTGDDARELFARSVGTSFLQVASDSSADDQLADKQDRLSEKAMKKIYKAARKHHDWALLSLAVRVRLDGFTKIKATMNKMLADLKQQQAEEYDKNEECKREIDQTEDSLKVAHQQKDDLGEENKDLGNTLEVLATEIKTLKQQVSDAEVNLKQAGLQRKKENQLFQQGIADQRATVKILNMALDRLKEFYTPGGALIQVHQPVPGAAVAPPPPKPKAYEKSAGAGGVLQLLMKVITDAEAEEKELGLDENQAQKMYGEFVASTTAGIESDRNSIAEKEKQTAETEGRKSTNEESTLSNTDNIEKLDGILTALHAECDYIIKYFKLRQEARAEEMDSIEDAIAILSGADFGR